MFRLFLFLIIFTALCPSVSSAAETRIGRETGLPVPRYVSLQANDINARVGPGKRYGIKWVYKRQSLPVEVLAEFDNWRKIRDFEGMGGWVHRSMLSGRRTIIVTDETSVLRVSPSESADAIARLERGVLGELEDCRGQWCDIQVTGYSGWIKRDGIWGVGATEAIEK